MKALWKKIKLFSQAFFSLTSFDKLYPWSKVSFYNFYKHLPTFNVNASLTSQFIGAHGPGHRHAYLVLHSHRQYETEAVETARRQSGDEIRVFVRHAVLIARGQGIPVVDGCYDCNFVGYFRNVPVPDIYHSHKLR